MFVVYMCKYALWFSGLKSEIQCHSGVFHWKHRPKLKNKRFDSGPGKLNDLNARRNLVKREKPPTHVKLHRKAQTAVDVYK